MAKGFKNRLLTGAGVVVAGMVVVGLGVYAYLQRNVPETYTDPVEHFKYGSIGADSQDGGVPYALWRGVPTGFGGRVAHHPPAGEAPFGLVYATPRPPHP